MTETTQPPKPGGKGRPTPKRSEAQKARKKPLVTPKGSTKEAAKAAREERAAERKKMREAMRTGDEQHYPPIAAGPERALVRDVVDVRRPLAIFAVIGWAAGLVLSAIQLPVTQAIAPFIVPGVVALLVVDGFAAARQIREALDERWPNGTKERRKGLVWYGVARNMYFRSRRQPPPRVEVGGGRPRP